MGQNPSQEAIPQIFPILWNQKRYHRIHKDQLIVPILIHIHPVQALASHFAKIHFNIIYGCGPTVAGTCEYVNELSGSIK
jgi:hypothetical protein